MTVRVEHKTKRSITAEVDNIRVHADIIDGERLFTVYGDGGQSFRLRHGADIDALIELLHAVKQHQAGPEPKRLIETDPALDIIAVEEPTA